MGFSLPTLPLSPIDERNQPPDYYLWVQDYLTIIMGVLWIVAYFLYMKQSYKDLSYGMPMLSLMCNIAWELVYGIFYPPGVAEFVTFLPYFLVDLGLVYTTLKFGHNEWKHAPIVANNLPLIMTVGCGMITWMQYSFAVLMSHDIHQASFWSGFGCQVIVSWAALAQLVSRDSTRGHTLAIWFYRFTGTLCAIGVFYWRVWWFPADYWYIHTPMTYFIFGATEIGELAYPIVYLWIQKREKAAAAKAKANKRI
ncbi:hypothetical protein P154DRAFT_537964 [Amniculicola lignicola CBS 123094]|uniref:Uncharacterized protein n=1 Tax=Amniculicola lignicola CBS 123094 TaxID=1392246 RepID=A0A6A5W678_9PLEO|nr:hypothetical protein P154DRAFT_537964 [Amniculicola lignicola CBS 123094]